MQFTLPVLIGLSWCFGSAAFSCKTYYLMRAGTRFLFQISTLAAVEMRKETFGVSLFPQSKGSILHFSALLQGAEISLNHPVSSFEPNCKDPCL